MVDGSEKRTVVIVGAGAAGLEASNILLANKNNVNGLLNVIVLEGRDRPGGRIAVHRNWDAPFDLGN